MKGSGEFSPLSFYELCAHMHVNETNFERHSSSQYNHMTYIGKTNIQSKQVY